MGLFRRYRNVLHGRLSLIQLNFKFIGFVSFSPQFNTQFVSLLLGLPDGLLLNFTTTIYLFLQPLPSLLREGLLKLLVRFLQRQQLLLHLLVVSLELRHLLQFHLVSDVLCLGLFALGRQHLDVLVRRILGSEVSH